jgi:chemotaxis protein CheZ
MHESDPELKTIVQTVKNITEGKWHADVDVNASGMVGELAQYINKTLKNLRQLDHNLGQNVQDTPRAKSEVQAVIDHTEKATIKVLDRAEDILSSANGFREDLDNVRSASNEASRNQALEVMDKRVGHLEQTAYELINTMEFQDVTAQKIRSIMGCLEDIENRLLDLLIIFKIKEQGSGSEEENVALLKNLHDDSYKDGNKQDLVDQLLAEFGM